MSWTPSTKEFRSVVRLAASKRYEYLVKKVADQKTVWSLWEQDGWALAVDSCGREAIPIWPHEEFARACATGSWVNYQPRAIDLETWIHRWVPGMEKEHRLVAVFPTSNGKGMCVKPLRFKGDIAQELEKYE